MTANDILKTASDKYHGTVLINTYGENALFYNPEGLLKRGVYFLTIKEKDGANDNASRLDRRGSYRINFGVSRQTFIKIFGAVPKRPVVGDIVDMGYDFTLHDKLLPHPVYAWMSWVSVINPTSKTVESIKYLHDESYDLAVKKYQKRIK